MVNEFIEFANMIKNNDLERCYKMLEHSLMVVKFKQLQEIKVELYFQRMSMQYNGFL
jgi:hypothetical protein